MIPRPTLRRRGYREWRYRGVALVCSYAPAIHSPSGVEVLPARSRWFIEIWGDEYLCVDRGLAERFLDRLVDRDARKDVLQILRMEARQ